jgi:hypothetical protein
VDGHTLANARSYRTWAKPGNHLYSVKYATTKRLENNSAGKLPGSSMQQTTAGMTWMEIESFRIQLEHALRASMRMLMKVKTGVNYNL